MRVDQSRCTVAMADLRERVGGLRYLETPLVRVGISPHAPYTVSDDLFRATAQMAREQRLPIAIHIAESELEHGLIVDASGAFAEGLRRRGIPVVARASSPVQLLAELRVLDATPLLIHCVRVDAHDIETIAASGSAVAHCPASNAKLGHGIAPLAELLAAGIVVGLGSDSIASNNRMDLLDEARLALLAQRTRLGSSETPSASDVLELATIGGARALGMGDLVGTLEPGKQADLAAFTLDGHHPIHDPVAAAVFALTGARARFVAVAGNVLLQDGRLTGARAGLQLRIEQVADALATWLAAGGELQGSV